MKIARPQMPPKLEDIALDEFLTGEIETVRLHDINATNCHAIALEMSGVQIEKVTFTQAQFERMSGRDVRIIKTDLSTAILSASTLNRVEFSNCRMVGADFNKTALHDITFKGCKLDMANFRFADLRRVVFTDCTFTEADFLGATLHDVSFQTCTLEKTVFEQVKAKNLDLRGSDLLELRGWGSLKGVTIDDLQLAAAAPYLAQELGLRVMR